MAEDCINLVKLGETTLRQVRDAHPALWLKHGFSMEKYMNDTNPVKRSVRTQLYVFRGPPGTGKSSYCRWKWPGAYYKAQDQWWDGYDQQEVVVIEEFNSKHMTIHQLKTLCDTNPKGRRSTSPLCSSSSPQTIPLIASGIQMQIRSTLMQSQKDSISQSTFPSTKVCRSSLGWKIWPQPPRTTFWSDLTSFSSTSLRCLLSPDHVFSHYAHSPLQ
jgi:hypothetical protein